MTARSLRGTESLLTHRWRGLDSNFQYAGGVKLVVVPLTPGCLGRVGSRRNDPATAIGAPRVDTIRPGGRMAGVGRNRNSHVSHDINGLTWQIWQTYTSAYTQPADCVPSRRLVICRPPRHPPALHAPRSGSRHGQILRRHHAPISDTRVAATLHPQCHLAGRRLPPGRRVSSCAGMTSKHRASIQRPRATTDAGGGARRGGRGAKDRLSAECRARIVRPGG